MPTLVGTLPFKCRKQLNIVTLSQSMIIIKSTVPYDSLLNQTDKPGFPYPDCQDNAQSNSQEVEKIAPI